MLSAQPLSSPGHKPFDPFSTEPWAALTRGSSADGCFSNEITQRKWEMMRIYLHKTYHKRSVDEEGNGQIYSQGLNSARVSRNPAIPALA